MVFSLLPTAVLAADGENPDASAGSGQFTQQNSKKPDDQADPDNQAEPDKQADPGDQSELDNQESQDDLNDSKNSDDSAILEVVAEGGELTAGNYILPDNIDLTHDLVIPSGAVVTIDLNGHTLQGTGKDSVIVVNGVLTVKDSSNNSGTITGGIGHASGGGNGGGAISIESGGKCTLEGGTLTGNHCNGYNYNAGGVYAKGTAEFYMTGGVITGNTANRQGGGVFGGGSSKIVISGGEISDNTAQFGGGVCYNGEMTMTGGTIKNNIAQYSEVSSWPNIMGGGIKVNSSNPLEFYGGEVFGNKAISSQGITALGAGIYGGDIKVMGDVKVYDNERDNTAENVYLDGSAMLEIVGKLDSNAKLPVTRATQTGRVTSSNGYPFVGIIIADDPALKLETREGDLYFTKKVESANVICTMQVEGNTLGYDSLSAALADLPSDDNVITLLKDIDLGAQVSVPANSGAATITAAEGTEPVVITWENATASYFSVPTGAELTVSGNIIIRGSNTKTASRLRAFDVAGTLNFGKENSESEYPKVEQFDLTNDNGYAAVYVNGGTLNLYSGTLSQNKGYYGGAVSVRYNGNAKLFGGTISGNTAPYGGGLYVANSTVTLLGTKISENSAQKGGGVYNQNGTVTIEKGEISGNQVDGKAPNGGGIYNDNTGTVTMNGGNINGNAVKVNVDQYGLGRGAAVYNSGTFTITAGTVSENYCEQGDVVKDQPTMYCAGLYNENQMEIAGGTISDNYYKFSAGAINSKCFSGVGVTNNGGRLTISGGTITGNGIQSGDSSVAGIAGAGVASTANTQKNAVFKMTGGTITGNNGGTGFGAGLYLENSGEHTSTATISGGSIVGNTGASGVYAAKANLSISGNPVIFGQEKNLYLGSNKITLSGQLTNGAAIGVTANTPTDSNPVQLTTAESSTEYYKDAAPYFIPDAADVIARANETGKYVELAYTADSYYTVTLHLSHASVSTGSPITKVKAGDPCTITIEADEGYTLPEVTQVGVTYVCNEDKTTAIVTVTPTENTDITIAAIPKPTDADLANGLVTVKCLSPVPHNDVRYGLNAAVAAKKYTKEQVNATEYSVTYDADAFAVNGHSRYSSADKLNWTLTYDGSKWNLAAATTGVDDVVLVTHAPTTYDEVTKFIDGQTDVIKTSCVNGETTMCAYGLMVAFQNPDHVVSVEQEKDSSSGKPIRGSYIATLKVDQFAEACASGCNGKSFKDSPRAHDVRSKNPVQWRFKLTQAEVGTDAGAGKPYVWSAEPVTPGTDDVCQVAHRVVLTFSYHQNGVTVDDTKVEYEYNTTKITNNVEVPTPTREGYTFVRWLDADGKAFDRTANVTEDHTYNNIEWKPIKYRVIFDANAGGKNVTGTMEDQVFTYDQPQTLNPNQFVCTDSVYDDRLKQNTQLYEFGGWNTKADGSGTAYTDEADFTNQSVKHGERITLYAQWKHVTKTLTYVSAHGTAPSTEDVDIFSEVTVAGAPANVEGYTFVGWRSNVAVGYEVMRPGDKFDMPNTDVTLTAQWEKEADSYTVTYKDGNWSEVKGSYKAGETVTVLAPAPAPEGYTFKYWRSSNEGKTYQPGDTFPMPNTNVTLTAIWDSETYTITWKNGDAILGKTNVKRGETPEYIGETPTKDATVDKTYTFKGWDPEITEATEDTTYTAQFDEAVRKYTIKFYSEGVLLASKEFDYGAEPVLGYVPTKDADNQYTYAFAGWTPERTNVKCDTEYYATYTRTVNKYTVTWVIDGDSTEETYEYGKMPAHADPVKAATDDTVYTFKGWTPALSIVTSNVTYTAQFDEITKHTVNYDLDGGTPAIDSAKYAAGDVVTTPASVPTKTGYVFTGWLVSFENKTVNANGSFTMPNTDVTLTAQWRVAITDNVYIPAMNPKHGTHEEPYSAQLTAKKDNAYGDPVAAGDVQFVLVDANGHADTSRNIGHGLTLNADGSITGTANGAGEVTFRVKLANADGDFVSDEIFAVTIVIEKARRNCTVTMEDWTFGDDPKTPVVTLSKTEEPETTTFYYKVKGAENSTYTTEVPVNAGDYTVKVVVAESANYLSCENTANFTIHKALITSVDPDVTAPVACEAAQSTIADGNGYTGTIAWDPADATFQYSTVYTATVVLTPDSNHKFDNTTTATNGWALKLNENGTLTLTKVFPKTAQDTVKTPVIRPNGGRFYGSETITITCPTDGADIYYTLDGTTPTTGSKQYTGAFKIKESTAVKAIAVKANYIDSAVATAEFTKRTGGNGGGGGGTVVTPVKPSKKDDSLKFNTEDHFAFVNGYPDGTVKPTGDVTRAEVAAILYRVMDADCVKTYETTRCSFSDVVRGDWFNLYVATLENAGVIVDTRTNGKFRPNEAITRAELAAMLAQFADIKSAANSFNDVSARHWASDEIAVCAKMGWINGYPDGSFRPDATITRAEMMAMINRALGRTPKSADDLLSGMKAWRDNANVNAWYYLDVQEATNSHTYTKSGSHETWKKLR